MTNPVILNFDESVGPIDNALDIDLGDWQERIRFSSRRRDFKELAAKLDAELPVSYGPVFLGSGDYHHVSHLLVSRLKYKLENRRLSVIIIDNHPDNMRFPFGIHCGSWVSHTAALPFVEHVHVIGITSHDIGWAHAIENRLTPLLRSKLTYWSTGVNTRWAHLLGLKHAFRSFADVDDLVSTFISAQYHKNLPVYLSIDKDALSADCLRTNWDQGAMEGRHITDLILAFGNRLCGCDITGEVSDYRYSTFGKRLMSRLDGQEPVDCDNLVVWQQEQHKFNIRLLEILAQYRAA